MPLYLLLLTLQVWVDGWDDVVRAVSALAKLPDDASAAAKAQ